MCGRKKQEHIAIIALSSDACSLLTDRPDERQPGRGRERLWGHLPPCDLGQKGTGGDKGRSMREGSRGENHQKKKDIHSGRLRLKMQKIHRVNLIRLNLLKSRKIIERR